MAVFGTCGAAVRNVRPLNSRPSMNVITRVKDAFGVPTYAYQVSGEYAMLKASGARGWALVNSSAARLKSPC